MPAPPLEYPVGQNAVTTYFDSTASVSDPYSCFPLPYNSGTGSATYINKFVTSATPFTSLKTKVGDYIWFFDDPVNYYDCRRIVGFSNNNYTAIVDRPFAAQHNVVEFKLIRPKFCKVEMITCPIGGAEDVSVMGVTIPMDPGYIKSIKLSWGKAADSHSAERNLLNPIIIDNTNCLLGKVIFNGTIY